MRSIMTLKTGISSKILNHQLTLVSLKVEIFETLN